MFGAFTSLEELAFLFPFVLIILGAIAYHLCSGRLMAPWVKVPISSSRGKFVYGLVFAGFFAPFQQEGDEVGAFLLRIVGLVVVATVISLIAGAAFGRRSIKGYAEEGAPGAGGMNWGAAFLAFLIIVGLAGPIIAAPTGVFDSWPVVGGGNLVQNLCGSLCE